MHHQAVRASRFCFAQANREINQLHSANGISPPNGSLSLETNSQTCFGELSLKKKSDASRSKSAVILPQQHLFSNPLTQSEIKGGAVNSQPQMKSQGKEEPSGEGLNNLPKNNFHFSGEQRDRGTRPAPGHWRKAHTFVLLTII